MYGGEAILSLHSDFMEWQKFKEGVGNMNRKVVGKVLASIIAMQVLHGISIGVSAAVVYEINPEIRYVLSDTLGSGSERLYLKAENGQYDRERNYFVHTNQSIYLSQIFTKESDSKFATHPIDGVSLTMKAEKDIKITNYEEVWNKDEKSGLLDLEAGKNISVSLMGAHDGGQIRLNAGQDNILNGLAGYGSVVAGSGGQVSVHATRDNIFKLNISSQGTNK